MTLHFTQAQVAAFDDLSEGEQMLAQDWLALHAEVERLQARVETLEAACASGTMLNLAIAIKEVERSHAENERLREALRTLIETHDMLIAPRTDKSDMFGHEWQKARAALRPEEP